MDGFLTFLLLQETRSRRSDGYNFSTLTVWRSKEDFQAWRESSANSMTYSKAGEAEPMFDGPPSPVMYEGVLALLSEKGA